MKRIIFLIGVCLGSYGSLLAQDTKTIRVKTGKSIPLQERYRYADFQAGSVSYTNGSTSEAKLNYHLFLDEMHFLNPKGDTLSLADEEHINSIQIGGDTFYYDHRNGYLEMVAEYPPLKLARKQILAMAGSEKMGAYGQSSGVSSIRNLTSYSAANSRIHKLQPKGDVLLSLDMSYYVIDQNKRSHTATKSGILKAFPKYKKQIERYLKEASIDLKKKEDLKKLIQFCSEIS